MSRDEVWLAEEDGAFSEEGYSVTDSKHFTIPLESQGQPGGDYISKNAPKYSNKFFNSSQYDKSKHKG